MIDSNRTKAHFPFFLAGRSERDVIVFAVGMSLTAAFGIRKLSSLLYLNHKLLPLLAPILVIVPIYLAWYAFRTVRTIFSAHAQRRVGWPLQPAALDSLRRFAETVSIFAVIEWLVAVGLTR